MGKKVLYKKENNLLQSLNWLAFQENYGRATLDFKNFSGVVLDLPFKKKAIWAQKAPTEFTDLFLAKGGVPRVSVLRGELPKGTVFLRLEPMNLSEKERKKYSLKEVSASSLLSSQKSPKATHVIDISKSEAELFAAMKPKTRYNIRLAERRGVSVKTTDDEDILFELLEETAKRQKEYVPHTKSYYTKLIKDLAKNEVAHIFVAYDNKLDPVAAILVSFFGEVATYLHGGFSSKNRGLMAPYLCHMEAIRYAKIKGCKYYDMWGVSEKNEISDPWYGITRFKEGFGGEKIVFPGSYDYVLDEKWYYLLTLLARIRRIFK